MRYAAIAIAMLCCGPTAARALDLRSGVPEGDIEIKFNVLVSTPLDPANEFAFIDLVPFNDGTSRLAVSTIQGGVRVIEADGDLSPQHLLTKAQTELVLPQEAGLTGIAFHPDFNNVGTFGYGKFYTITTEASENNGGLGDADVDFPFHNGTNNEEHQDVLREWDLKTFGNVPGNAANNQFSGTLADSRELLRTDRPGPFHNMVDLTFNPTAQPTDDDYGILYITSGDGGNRTGHDRANAAQDLGTIFGKVLRIDPDPTAHPLVRVGANSGSPAYSIPSDNPYNGDDAVETRTSPTLAEVWAQGFRSPWRLNFDRLTGDLFLGDVGENAWEEVDVVQETLNYGWGHMEGTHDGTLLPGDGTLVPGLTLPIIELGHTDAARSINGGFVYRGSAIPELYGKYVFSDLGQGFNSSAIFYAIVDPSDPDGDVGDVFEFKLHPLSPKFENNTQELPERIFSVGEDLNGEIYLIGGPDPRQPFNPNRPSVIVRLDPSPPFLFGSLNGDLLIDLFDWDLFKAGQGTNFNGMTPQQSYYFGDLDGNLQHDLFDFILFRNAYEDFNGDGSFARMLSAPEPSTMVLIGLLTWFGAAVPSRTRNRQLCR
jgi:glucose/arabinose dehydrogenase